MRKTIGFSLIAGSLILGLACSDDDDGDPMGMGGGAGMAGMAGMAMAGNAGSGGAGMMPAGALGRGNPPQLGARMDRAGRVAITAALIGAFEPEAADATAKRDSYNDGSQARADSIGNIEVSLGILDGLDLNCGNQFLAGEGARQYSALAGALADDQLYLDSNTSQCDINYLSLEAGVEGACGGRTPGEDVIDVSYSVLAAGVLSGVGDGVNSDDANTSEDVFPFLSQPSP